MADGCLLLLPAPPPVVDMSNGVADPIVDGFTDILLDCGAGDPVVPAVPKGVADDDAAADGIVNDMPRSAAIGCHGLRADRLSSLPVILAFRNDLHIIKIVENIVKLLMNNHDHP